MAQICLFDEQVNRYLQSLIPAKSGLARWRQYERAKRYLLSVVSPSLYDAAIRKLADKLHI